MHKPSTSLPTSENADEKVKNNFLYGVKVFRPSCFPQKNGVIKLDRVVSPE